MEFLIWWDFQYSPETPWHFEGTYLGKTFYGSAKTFQGCSDMIQEMMFDFGKPVIQDNIPQKWYN